MDIPELTSDHEEEDTRLTLHANHATSRGQTSVIWSPDTDVAIIALSTIATHQRSSVVFATGTGNRRRILNLSAMADQLGTDKSTCLIGLHSLTGCDSTSSFYGRGKASCLKTFLAEDSNHTSLQNLGTAFKPPDHLISSIEGFVCRLYGSASSSVNETRSAMQMSTFAHLIHLNLHILTNESYNTVASPVSKLPTRNIVNAYCTLPYHFVLKI